MPRGPAILLRELERLIEHHVEALLALAHNVDLVLRRPHLHERVVGGRVLFMDPQVVRVLGVLANALGDALGLPDLHEARHQDAVLLDGQADDVQDDLLAAFVRQRSQLATELHELLHGRLRD